MQRTYQFDPSSGTAPDAVSLGPDLLARLVSAGQRRSYADGQMLQQQGDTARGFWAIVSGNVLIGRMAADGGMTSFAVLGEGDLFGELAFFARIERQADAIAQGDCVVVWLSEARLTPLLAELPELSRMLLGSLARQLQLALTAIDERRLLTTPARLASLLLRMDAGCSGQIASSQQNLADLLGLSRVSLVTALAQLARTGLVQRGYRRLTIRDRPGLARIVDPVAAIASN